MENVHNTINNLLAENGIFYYDFNMARQDVLPRTDSDFVDKEGHMNGEFAKNIQNFLAKLLKNINRELKILIDISTVHIRKCMILMQGCTG